MKPREWYRAEIRWAVMEDKRGLQFWEDTVYFFLSEDRDSTLKHALEIGWRERDAYEDGRRWVEKRLARIVSLDCLGSDQTQVEVRLASQRAKERLPFEHEFDPEGTQPMSVF
jgi:KaiC/GvpD/RAD55 family RecA-like ATPase